MGKITAGVFLRHLRRLAPADFPEQGSDSDLLRRYATQRDEPAFALLVQRHGPMVWNTCRRALRDHHDAEDVFQATFLVLAKKAGAVRWRGSVAGWLYAVALRLAAKARCQAARRPHPAPVEPAAPDPFEALSARDLLAAFDAEMAALPERFRGPAVLCWLEGRTQQEAARLLGSSLRTLRRRLEQGKRLLHARLARRGMTLAVALAAPALADAVPATALAAARGGTATPRAAALAQALLSAAAGRFRAALVFLAACAVAAGVGLAAYAPQREPAGPARQDERALTRPAGKDMKRVDLLGDPLPAGAVLRLGSTRLRGESSFAVAFSPDGKWLAAGGWDKRIRLWDAETGKEVRTLFGPERGVWAVAFSRDGKLLAGAGLDKTVYLWDPATGKDMGRLEGFPEDVHALAFSPKGDRLVTGDVQSVRLWQVPGGKLLHTLQDKGANAVSVAFAPDGRTVAADCDHNTVKLWDTDGKLLHDLKGQVRTPVAFVTFSPDGKLVTVGPPETRVWDAATGKKLDDLGGARGGGSCVAFSPDGKLLALGGADQRVHVWDWKSRKEILHTRRHPDRVRTLAFSPDGRALASVGDASPIHLWDPSTGQPKLSLAGHQERLNSVACAPDGRTIVTCAWDGTARVWDARTGREIRQLDVVPKTEEGDRWRDPEMLGKVVVSPDARLAAVARGDEIVVVCDLATGKEVRRFKGMCLAFSPDGKWVAVGSRSTSEKSYNVGEIRLYDRATWEQRREIRGHLTPVAGLAFTPDSQALVARGVVFFGARTGEIGESETRHIRVWDLATGKQRRALAVKSHPNGLALAPDGRTAATTGLVEKKILLWEVATGDQRGELTGHTQTVFDIAYTPDGRTVATAGMDGTVRLWDAVTMEELGRLEGHRGWVLTVAFSPDGTRLVSGSLDTTALVWDVSRFTKRPAQTAELTAADLEACWEDLAVGAARAYRAMGKMLAAPAPTVAFLGGRVKPAPAAEARRVAALIADLGSEQFKTRDQAMKELEKLGEVAAPALHKAYAGDPPLEVKRRLEVLLEKLSNWPPETLRQVRAVEALEGIGSAEARRLLTRLVAEGSPPARLTREARLALDRLTKVATAGP
jgi:RNA polymerase sigma factor (sigma-70 family)